MAPPTVTFAVALTLGSPTDVALLLTTVAGAGRVAAAVQVVATPLPVVIGETVPHGALQQDTVQVTPRLSVSFVMVAVTWAVAAGSTRVWSAETLRVTRSFGALLVPSPPQAVSATESTI